jgi:hypothetical protein
MVPSYLAVDSIQNIGLDVHLTTSQKQKASASISKKLISFMINQMQDFGKNVKHLAIEKTLSHSMMMKFLTPYLSDLVTIKQNQMRLFRT